MNATPSSSRSGKGSRKRRSALDDVTSPERNRLDEIYNSFIIKVSTKEIVTPSRTIRPVDRDGDIIPAFAQVFYDGGYPKHGNYISVCLLAAPGKPLNNEEVYKALQPTGNDLHVLSRTVAMPLDHNLRQNVDAASVTLVDGAHRLAALRLPQVRMKLSPFQPVKLWFRADGNPMTLVDIHVIGGNLNDISSSVKTMSKHDRISQTLNLIRVVYENPNYVGDYDTEKSLIQGMRSDGLSPTNVRQLCVAHQIMARIKTHQASRYCTIAVGLYNQQQYCEEAFLLVKEFRNLQHCCSQTVWETKSPQEQLFVLKGLLLALNSSPNTLEDVSNKSPTVRRSARTKDTSEQLSMKTANAIAARLKSFYRRIIDVYRRAGAVSEDEILDNKVSLQGVRQQKDSLRDCLIKWIEHHMQCLRSTTIMVGQEDPWERIISSTVGFISNDLKIAASPVLQARTTSKSPATQKSITSITSVPREKDAIESVTNASCESTEKVDSPVQPTVAVDSISQDTHPSVAEKDSPNAPHRALVEPPPTSSNLPAPTRFRAETPWKTSKSIAPPSLPCTAGKTQAPDTGTTDPKPRDNVSAAHHEANMSTEEDDYEDRETRNEASSSRKPVIIANKKTRKKRKGSSLHKRTPVNKRRVVVRKPVTTDDEENGKATSDEDCDAVALEAPVQMAVDSAQEKIKRMSTIVADVSEKKLAVSKSPCRPTLSTPSPVPLEHNTSTLTPSSSNRIHATDVEKKEPIETEDEHGFCIVKRGENSFTYKNPKPDLSCMRDLQFREPEPGYLPVKWYYGSVIGKTGLRTINLRLFDDRLDGTFNLNPSWAMKPSPTNKNVLELNFVRSSPSYKDKELVSSLCLQSTLRILGFQPPHPALFLMKPAELVLLRRIVHHALMADYDNLGRNMACSSSSACIIASKLMAEATTAFLRLKRSKLDHSGFLVIAEFLGSNWDITTWYPADKASIEGDCSHSTVQANIESLLTHFQDLTPTKAEIDTKSIPKNKNDTWSNIRQKESFRSSEIDHTSHLMSNKEATNNSLEAVWPTSGNGETPLRGRIYLDVLLALTAHLLRLDQRKFDTDEGPLNVPRLRMPCSGGRFLTTMCEHTPQGSHCDFYYDYPSLAEHCTDPGGIGHTVKYPPYTVIFYTQDTPLWIAPGSHRFVFCTPAEMREVAKHTTMDLHIIPANSLLIMRGDTLHAGGGARASSFLPCLRYHYYFYRAGILLADGINDRNSTLQITPKDAMRDPVEEDKTFL